MKKRLALVIILALVMCMPVGRLMAEEKSSESSLPKNMPERYEAACVVEGIETKGVTFVVSEMVYDGEALRISVLQLPNDDDVAIIDSQVEDESNKNHLDDAIETATPYGDKISGTVCDIWSITDTDGNNLIREYKATLYRNGASLETVFEIYFLPENTEIAIELFCGIDEDLDSRCSASDQIHLTGTLNY